jgi:hypothetical protein
MIRGKRMMLLVRAVYAVAREDGELTAVAIDVLKMLPTTANHCATK